MLGLWERINGYPRTVGITFVALALSQLIWNNKLNNLASVFLYRITQIRVDFKTISCFPVASL